MAKKTKSEKVTDDSIIAGYMNYVLEHETLPKSIYKFCIANDIEEAEFYQYFGSFEALRNGVWAKFFANTEKLLTENTDYAGASNREKLLTFFFTFFELLTLNRSYVLFALNEHSGMLRNMEQLKGLRKQIKAFATDLIEEGNADKSLKITQHNPQLFSEGAWVQFLFLLKFWMDDNSPAFEKTDIAIEKSVNTVFDVFDNTPLENIIDFGKFLFKEKIG